MSYPGGAPVTLVGTGAAPASGGAGSANNPFVTTNQPMSYVLANQATSTGNQSPIAGSYALNLPSAFNGATITITFTSSNGTTATATYTAAPAMPPIFGVFAGTTVSAAVTNGTPNSNTTFSGGPTLSNVNALPPYQAVAPTPVSNTVSNTTQTDIGPFTPQLGRPINVLVTGTWAGTVQVLRSLDSGATRNPITAAGAVYANFKANAQEAIGSESDPAATFYLRVTLTSGAATGMIR